MSAQTKRVTRGLTNGETEVLKKIYHNSLDYGRIKIHNFRAQVEATDSEKKELSHRSHALSDDVHLVGGDYRDDMTYERSYDVWAVFFHEIAHVWQHQKQNPIKDKGNKKHSHYDHLYVKYVDIKAKYDSLPMRKSSFIAGKHEYTPSALKKFKDYFQSMENLDMQMGQVFATFDQRKSPVDRKTLLDNDIGEIKVLPQSEYVWKTNPVARTIFGTIDDMKAAWREHFDYNYLFQKKFRRLTKNKIEIVADGDEAFYNLPIEAQAQFITEYCIMKFGGDPVKVPQCLYATGEDRPDIKLYETYIPFVRKRMTLKERLNFNRKPVYFKLPAH